MFLTSGERQKFEPAQDMTVNLGKVLHLTAEGAPAPGNPWASRGGIAATFWTMGHRNVLGLAFAPDGRLWESEMGPKGGDEVNLILPGKNYGWPRASNGSHYDGSDIPDHRPGDGFEPPKVWWNPSISPGALMIYTGDLFPQWKGDALIGALVGRGVHPRRHRRRQGAQGRPMADGRAHPRGRPGPARRGLSARGWRQRRPAAEADAEGLTRRHSPRPFDQRLR